MLYTLNLGFSDGSGDKEFACNAGDLDSVPGLGRSPGVGLGTPVYLSGVLIRTEEPDELESMGLQRGKHDRVTKNSTVQHIP